MAPEVKNLTHDTFWNTVSISQFCFKELLQNNEREKYDLQV